jgi:hypothetical protein
MKIIRAVLATAALCAVFGQAGNAADDRGPADPPPLAPPISAPVPPGLCIVCSLIEPSETNRTTRRTKTSVHVQLIGMVSATN